MSSASTQLGKLSKRTLKSSSTRARLFDRCKLEMYKCSCELKRLHDDLINPDMYTPVIERNEAERVGINILLESLRKVGEGENHYAY